MTISSVARRICDSIAWYIWLNPVRKGIVSDAREHPFSGSFTVGWPMSEPACKGLDASVEGDFVGARLGATACFRFLLLVSPKDGSLGAHETLQKRLRRTGTC